MSWREHLRPALASLSIYDVPPSTARARLHANECPEPWPAEVMQALGDVVAQVELNRYPDTSGRDLRAVLARRHDVEPRRVVLGNGSDEIISTLLTALSGSPSRGALVIPTPTFVMYAHSARVLGVDVREVPLDDAFELDAPAMHEALVGAALCFLARPNNPTSSLWDAALIGDLIERHPSTVFVLDEAYADYAPGSSLWRPDGPDNVVLMRTLSKVGLAALRLGYCVACPELAEALDKVRHPYNVSQTTLALAQAVLERFDDVQRGMLERAIANRDRLHALLSRIDGARVYPAHGNLVLLRFEVPDRAPDLVRTLAEHDVRIKDVSAVPRLQGCVRISVGTSEELDLLSHSLADLGWLTP